MIKVRSTTTRSASFELINEDKYYTEEYNIYLNEKLIKSCDKNVFTLFNLKPDTSYSLRIKNETITFSTKHESYFINVLDFNACNDGTIDSTLQINTAISVAKKDSTVYIPKGTYLVTSIFLKSDITLYIDSNATLIGELDRNKYPILKGDLYDLNLGTFEGKNCDIFASLLNMINVKNCHVVGEGVIDQRAYLSDWYEDYHTIRKAYRPYGFYSNRSKNISLIGLTVKNTAAWNIHPYFSSDIKLINLNLENPINMPTTDGIDPDAVDGCLILGNDIKSGDDCIAIKSFKYEYAKKYQRSSKNITIRNCIMREGHGGIVLGSELSGGISNLNISNCIFKNTDRGLRIKTRRGRGQIGEVTNIKFNNIFMDNVKCPFVINMYYNMGSNGAPLDPIVHKHEFCEFNELTPVMGKFIFKNIKAINCHYQAGLFLGLAESPIEEIVLENVSLSFNKNATSGYCDMYEGRQKKLREGFYLENVKKFREKNVNVEGFIGQKYIIINNG